MKRRNLGSFEQLENRLCLSVTVEVDHGDLIVSGDADGTVQITAVDETTFQVVDDGGDPVMAEGVTDDIRIDLDTGDAAANDQVTLDLAGQAVDRVVVELGDGDNSFLLQGGTVQGSLKYVGGGGDDVLQIAADAVVERSVCARLGDGDNSVLLEGRIERNLSVMSGAGDDQVQILQDARVERNVTACLGNGDNRFTQAGDIGRALCVRGGADDDTVEILAGAAVERSVSVSLGDGDNSFTLGGGEEAATDAVVEGYLSFRAAAGNDAVEITENGTVGKDAFICLGQGDNTVVHAGEIEGDLRVVSANEEDVVDLDSGIVGGETQVNLGEQFVCGRPGWHFGHGWRFGHGWSGGLFGFRLFGGRGFRR